MNDLQYTRKFEYRRRRIKARFNVDFIAEGRTLHGLCKDVSDAGIRAELDGPLAVGSSGLLILRHPSGALTLEARVSHIEKCQVGLAFLFRSPAECQKAVEFIASLANPTIVPRQK